MNDRERQRMSQRRHRARSLAVQALYQWQLADTGSGDLIVQFHQDEGMDRADGEYFDELVRACVGDADGLREIYLPHLDRPEDQLDPIERAIILVGVQELRRRLDVPYRVVLDEAISLARRYGSEDSHRYVNAVLDGVASRLRQGERGAGGRRDRAE
jgi:transcription antitermination protein NusB